MATDVGSWHNFFDEDTHYTGPQLSAEMIGTAETQLGYKLPESYLQLLRVKNGGSPRRKCFPTGLSGWADDHVQISRIRGIGGTWGIDSQQRGNRYMIEEWGYPDIGVLFGQTPSAGHDGIMMDYSLCGPKGEPRIIHVDVEGDAPQIRILAPNFETFLLGLVDCGPFLERIESALDRLGS